MNLKFKDFRFKNGKNTRFRGEGWLNVKSPSGILTPFLIKKNLATEVP
jgi:hypothetical protein